jgi:hypothetical protein
MRACAAFVGWTLLATLAGSAALVACRRTASNSQVTACANNLSQLWKMMLNYMVQFGGPQKRMAQDTGGAFWLRMSKPPTLLIDPSIQEIYFCPGQRGEMTSGTTDYRGPSSTVDAYRDNDPVGADKAGNHGEGEGGNVIRKSGDVQNVGEQDALWAAAAQKTSP